MTAKMVFDSIEEVTTLEPIAEAVEASHLSNIVRSFGEIKSFQGARVFLLPPENAYVPRTSGDVRDYRYQYGTDETGKSQFYVIREIVEGKFIVCLVTDLFDIWPGSTRTMRNPNDGGGVRVKRETGLVGSYSGESRDYIEYIVKKHIPVLFDEKGKIAGYDTERKLFNAMKNNL